jgi:hypothetical protein
VLDSSTADAGQRFPKSENTMSCLSPELSLSWGLPDGVIIASYLN